jgi:hypothetical protein
VIHTETPVDIPMSMSMSMGVFDMGSLDDMADNFGTTRTAKKAKSKERVSSGLVFRELWHVYIRQSEVLLNDNTL